MPLYNDVQGGAKNVFSPKILETEPLTLITIIYPQCGDKTEKLTSDNAVTKQKS